jgi:hypothetical protein
MNPLRELAREIAREAQHHESLVARGGDTSRSLQRLRELSAELRQMLEVTE